MIEGSQVFIDIDTQRDFLEPQGALYVAGSIEIVPNLGRLTAIASFHAIPVLATACAHTREDSELVRFPPHCMIGTPGQERIPATQVRETLALSGADPLPEHLPRHVTLLKREFDMFSNPHADTIIRRHEASRPVFVVYGVATDYCVEAAVCGLLARRCKVALVVDAIRAISASAESAILSGFAQRGVLLTLTEVVCGASAADPP
jgi:nicotinamidase/pyrazinamidase